LYHKGVIVLMAWQSMWPLMNVLVLGLTEGQAPVVGLFAGGSVTNFRMVMSRWDADVK
jgi:hypothetical protein